MKRYLFILQQEPFNSSLAEEALELILAVSAFEQKITLVFKDAGVLQLIRGEGFTKTFAGLHLFDITEIYLQAGSLEKYNISLDQLSIQPEIITDGEIEDLISTNDVVLKL